MTSDLPSSESAETPVQFSLRALLVLQAICAVFLAMLLATGAFAVLVTLVATIVLMAVRVRPNFRRLKELGVDLLGGLILPVLCLVYAPGFLRDSPVASVVYPMIVVQVVALALWQFIGPMRRWFCAFMAGLLMIGALTAGVIGLCMIPFSLIGVLFFGIGLLGLTPFLTAYVFGRNAAKALWGATDWRRKELVLALGIAASIVLPVAIHFTCGPAFVRTIQAMASPTLSPVLEHVP